MTVSFTPGAADVGPQTARLLVDGTPRVILTAYGLADWGDASQDGSVDVGDIVTGIDAVLGRVILTTPARASLDVYPFPDGDEQLDVRDLTVLTQAVLRGEWPNAAPVTSILTLADKGPARTIRFAAERGMLTAEISEPVRAIQAEFAYSGTASRAGEALIAQTPRGVRLIWAPLSGAAIEPGSHPVAALPESKGPPRLLAGLVIGPSGERLRLGASDLPAEPRQEPYPNPFAPRLQGDLILPATGTVRILNLLGREVWRGSGRWDGTARAGHTVAAGLYTLVSSAGRSWRVIVIN